MKKYYIGIDLGGTNIKVALLTKGFSIVSKVVLDTASYKKPSKVIPAIKDSIDNILKEKKASLKDVDSIGIGVAGVVDASSGVIHNLVNIPGWKGINIKKLLGKVMHLPVYADNDANVMTLAEARKGAGRGKKNLICVTLGTGVGGGIILDGKLYRGSTSAAGEIGHIPINEIGPKCNCGGVACVETYVGNKYIVRMLREALKNGKKTILKKLAGDNLSKITPRLLFEAARKKDKFAIEFWNEIGVRIGIALSGVINLLNPDRVVIGGGVADAGEFILSPIRKTVKTRAMSVQARHVTVVKAKLGQDAGLVGAAVLAHMESN